MATQQIAKTELRYGKEHFEAYFLPETYLQECYPNVPGTSSMSEFNKSIIEWLHKQFASGTIEGRTLLDVGSGPSIRTAISASRRFDSIFLMEFTKRNRDFVKSWLEEENSLFDWSNCFKYMADLEGGTTHTLEERTRAAIKGVYPCDLTEPNPLHSLDHLQVFPADAIAAILSIGSAVTSEETYMEVLTKLRAHIKPKGHLLLAESTDDLSYNVGEQTFHYVSLRPTFFDEVLGTLGYRVVDYTRRTFAADMERVAFPKVTYLSMITAQRM